MRVTMMLADNAQVADGKLYILGGGWSLTGPGPVSCGVALLFHVPWDRTNRKTKFSVWLVDEDGQQVTQAGPLGEQPVQIGGEFEVGRPAGVKAGAEISIPVAFNNILQLAPGKGFTWVLEVDGQRGDDWKLPFTTREHPQQ
jgi:Family of unknown function (DUF6941)